MVFIIKVLILYFLSNQIVQIFEYKNIKEMFIIQVIFHFSLFFFNANDCGFRKIIYFCQLYNIFILFNFLNIFNFLSIVNIIHLCFDIKEISIKNFIFIFII